MTESLSDLPDDSTDSCPLCGASLQNSQYPRHRLILEDESDSGENQHAEGRLCPDCWTRLRDELTPPELVMNERENSTL